MEAEARGDAAMLVHVDGHVLDVADEQAHLLADVHVSREQLALILGIIHAVTNSFALFLCAKRI